MEQTVERKTYTKAEAEQTLAALAAGTISLTCGRHNYVYKRGGLPPLMSGCPECWKVYFVSQFCMTPKANQAEFVEGLEEALHHAAECDDRGEFDFIPYARPQITIEKGAE